MICRRAAAIGRVVPIALAFGDPLDHLFKVFQLSDLLLDGSELLFCDTECLGRTRGRDVG